MHTSNIVYLHGLNELGNYQAQNVGLGGSSKSITVEHFQSHAGKTFQLLEFVTLSGTTPYYILFSLGDLRVHFKDVILVSQKNDFVLDIFEAPTVTELGVANGIITLNRNSDVDPDVIVYNGSSVSDDGELINKYYLPGGTAPGGNSSGTVESDGWEILLKPNTIYAMKAYRLVGTDDCNILIKYRWYLE